MHGESAVYCTTDFCLSVDNLKKEKKQRKTCVGVQTSMSMWNTIYQLFKLRILTDDPKPSWSAVTFLRLVVFNASLQPHRNDSRLNLMRILHAQAHPNFRSLDPQHDLIWRAMTKNTVQKTTNFQM